MTREQILQEAGLTPDETQELIPYLTGESGDFYATTMYDKLFDYFVFKTGEMPYATAKARKGDPDTWILTYLNTIPTQSELDWLASPEK